MRTFEFHAYAGDEHGNTAVQAEITTKEFAETVHAKAYAGRLAKKVNGPVDLARHGEGAWCERYITTAEPNEYTSTGYSFGIVN